MGETVVPKFKTGILHNTIHPQGVELLVFTHG